MHARDLAVAVTTLLLGSCAADKTDAERCADLGGSLCGAVCTDVRSDNLHCGDCATSCTPGQYCQDGVCADGCAAWGGTLCGDLCVDVSTDDANCGSCDHPCAEGFSCDAGACVLTCQSPQIACSTSGGAVCLDPTADTENCGECGVVCDQYSICHDGACVSPWFDADPCVVYTAATESVASLLDAIGRTPDAAAGMIASAQARLVWPADSTQLCDRAQLTRMVAMGHLFMSISERPAAYDSLALAAALLGPPPDPSTASCDAEAGRFYAGELLMYATAMEPAAASPLLAAASTTLGAAPSAARLCALAHERLASAVGGLFRAIQLKSAVGAEILAAFDFIAPADQSTASCDERGVYVSALGRLYEGLGANPTAETALLAAASHVAPLLADPGDCCTAQIAKMQSAALLFASAGRSDFLSGDPAVCGALSRAAALYAPANGPERCCQAEGQRMAAVSELFMALATNPGESDCINELAMSYIGPAPALDGLCTYAAAERQAALGSLYRSLAWGSAAEAALLTAADTFLGAAAP